MPTEQELEQVRKIAEQKCSNSGIDVDYIILNKTDNNVFKLEISYYGLLTFDILERLAVVFQTKLINLDCNCGTGSDHCHDKMIYVDGALIDLNEKLP